VFVVRECWKCCCYYFILYIQYVCSP